MAVPPSLRVSVGVPPATVTASLRLSVSVTVLPALRSPLAGDSVKRRDGRRCGVDLRAALGQAGEREVGGIAGAVGDGRGVEIDGGGGEGRGVLPGGDGVAEGQRIAAGAARIGGGAAVVEGERRRAARDRHRLAEVECQRDGLAGIEVAARRRLGQATRWSAWWCRSAGRSGSDRRARGWRHCRRRR